jgi:hypothetical protein
MRIPTRFTLHLVPFEFYICKISLIARAITWWIPGKPFAEGGPSKNTMAHYPHGWLHSNMFSFFQKSSTSDATVGKSSPLYSVNFVLYPFFNRSASNKIMSKVESRRSKVAKRTTFVWSSFSTYSSGAIVYRLCYKYIEERTNKTQFLSKHKKTLFIIF